MAEQANTEQAMAVDPVEGTQTMAREEPSVLKAAAAQCEIGFTNRFFIWDTESTGIKPTEDDIISLGGVLCEYDGRKFVKIDEFHSYVDTDRKIDPAAQSVHHISKQTIRGQPRFPEMVKILRTFLVQHQPGPNCRIIFVAHNGSKFDDIILYCNFVQHNLNFDRFLKDVHCYGFVDTLKYLRGMLKDAPYKDKPKDANTGRESFALGHCYTTFCGSGQCFENAHDALADSRALFDVLNSEQISAKINLVKIFENVVAKEKQLKWVKQTAGVAFQTREQNTMKESRPEFKETKEADLPSELRNVPIFEPEDSLPSDSKKRPYRLCMNCVSFVRVEEHRVCELDGPPKSMRHEEEDTAVQPDDIVSEPDMDEDRDFAD